MQASEILPSCPFSVVYTRPRGNQNVRARLQCRWRLPELHSSQVITKLIQKMKQIATAQNLELCLLKIPDIQSCKTAKNASFSSKLPQ